MNNYTYNFEIEDTLKLFVSAFDDAFIYRHDDERERHSKIGVRYVFGPKQRVLHDIVNKEKHVTLPVVAIDQTNLERDPSRIINKDQYAYRPNGNDGVSKIPTPVPIKMSLDVTMIAKYKSDIDQIVTNFAAYANPYFVVTWNTPKEFSEVYRDAINLKIHWSGDVSLDTPTSLAANDKYRITATTTFVVEGWLFPADERTVGTIYTVNTDFKNLPLITDFDDITSDDLDEVSTWDSETETVSVSARPDHTNSFYRNMNGTTYTPIRSSLILNLEHEYDFLFYGRRYEYNNQWLLSGADLSSNTYPLTTIETIQDGSVTGYLLDSDVVTTINDNISIITVESNSFSGDFQIVTTNEVGFSAFEHVISLE